MKDIQGKPLEYIIIIQIKKDKLLFKNNQVQIQLILFSIAVPF